MDSANGLDKKLQELIKTVQRKDTQKDIEDIMSLISDYGQIGGDHHKAWVLDQIVHIIMKDKYDEFVKYYCEGEDGPDTYGYDAGVAP